MRAHGRVEVPALVLNLLERLRGSGYEAFIVGGAVRDMVMRRPVTDWDITTSARPEEITTVFRDISHFSLKHDTVTLVNNGNHFEVTPFRRAMDYGRTIEEDLGHRDFTLNAMAYDHEKDRIIDPYGGREDIKDKRIRAVSDARERFLEDPLRLLRAVRVATELRFKVEENTLEVMEELANQIASTAKERIRDELMKILMCPKPSTGFDLLRRTTLLDYVLPELLEGYRKKQNPRYHRYTIFRHIMETVDRVEATPVMRLTALLHDIAKPRVREKIGGVFRFYGHEKAGAELAGEIMVRLKFSKDMIDQVTRLIIHHVIGYDASWGDGAVRRLVRRVGPQYMDRLLAFRREDLMAHGMEDTELGLLSELEKRAKNIIQGPMAVKPSDLAVDGNTVMEVLNLSPGQRVGRVLNRLMEAVTENPTWNTREKLLALLEEMKV